MRKGKRQRFYARNAVKTTFRPRHRRSTTIDPALTGFAGECCGMLARVIAYVGALALLAIVGIRLWDQLPEKTKTYRIFRHPEGEHELEAAAVISQQIRRGCAA